MFRTLLLTAAIATAATAFATPAAQASSGYSWGPKGSCKIGSTPGYKEYYNGRADGRCVLQ